MGQKEPVISELYKELGITQPTIYRYFRPNGVLREYGKKGIGLINIAVKQPLTPAKFKVVWPIVIIHFVPEIIPDSCRSKSTM
jgi:hypothetical protein